MPKYNPTQTTYLISLLSNSAAGAPPGSVSEIEAYAYTAIKWGLLLNVGNIGLWEVVWGPAVYQAPSSERSDNTIFVAQAGAGSANPGELVVGVAGTNPYSIFDWLAEDFFVSATVPWMWGKPPSGSKPQLSMGTFLGLSILQTLKPGPDLPGVGTTLREFLSTALTAKTPLTVTGHSLGGALTPALTLWLSDTRKEWDPKSFATLACMPSAGPTSGDADFASYYDSQLGSVTNRIYNKIDVVPQAWETDTLKPLPSLYQPYIDPGLIAQLLVDGAVAISQPHDYTQICASTPPFQGAVNQAIINPADSGCANYFTQAIYQHVDAYSIQIGLTAADAIMAPVKRAAMESANAIGSIQRKLQRKALTLQQLQPRKTGGKKRK